MNASLRPILFASLIIAAILNAEDARWIDKRVQEIQPTVSEKRFDDIGWAPDICTALKLAREQGRGVFLFTHDGRMETGRC